jgi:hypothetical protein
MPPSTHERNTKYVTNPFGTVSGTRRLTPFGSRDAVLLRNGGGDKSKSESPMKFTMVRWLHGSFAQQQALASFLSSGDDTITTRAALANGWARDSGS